MPIYVEACDLTLLPEQGLRNYKVALQGSLSQKVTYFLDPGVRDLKKSLWSTENWRVLF